MKQLLIGISPGAKLARPTPLTVRKPILFYGIEDLVEAGCTEIGIIVGDTADEIIEAVGDGSGHGCKITYIHQEEPLGLAHCVLIARDFIGNDDDPNDTDWAETSSDAGFTERSKSMYIVALDSGDVLLLQANTGGAGVFESLALEGSTVDLAEQFTNMIVTQRAYSASAKIITTADEEA